MFKKIITKDNSITYYNKEFDETYHSISGAIEEAREKHVIPSKIIEIAKKQNQVTIVDVCFGLGYNSLIAIHEIKKVNPSCKIKIIALEIDPKIIQEQTQVPKEFEQEYQSLKKQIILMIGDARQTIKTVKENVDAVFFDPFSPKKCPQLWTKEFFTDIYKVMNINARLTTYSCARVVRDNLKLAGFKVIDGPCVGRRAPSTIAMKLPADAELRGIYFK